MMNRLLSRSPFLQQLVLTFAVLSTCAPQLLVHFSPTYFGSAKKLLELQGEWRACFSDGPAETTTEGYPNTTCLWFEAPVPQPIKKTKQEPHEWLIYTKEFRTPTWCLEASSTCALAIGEVTDAVQVSLNGIDLGLYGRLNSEYASSKMLPATFLIPNSALRTRGINRLVASVYTKNQSVAGISLGPVGIIPAAHQVRFILMYVTKIVILPLTSALVLLTAAALCLLSIIYGRAKNSISYSFFVYCLLTTLFLFSMSRIQREFMPHDISYALHFVIRSLSDLSFVLLIANWFNNWGRLVRVALGFNFLGMFLSSATTAIAIFTSTPGSEFYTIHLAATLETLTRVLPHILALWLTWRANRPNPEKRLLFALFSITSIMNLSDSFAFLHIIDERFFSRFSAVYVSLTFGYLLVLHHFKERKDLEVSATIGTVITQVAHDIRSPLAALQSLTFSATNISDDVTATIRGSTQRIRGIAEQLLSLNRSLQSSDSSEYRNLTSSLSTEGFPIATDIIALVNEIIREKRLQLHERTSELTIELISEATDVMCNIRPMEFLRVASNILDNSIEAIKDTGRIKIVIRKQGHFALIDFFDGSSGFRVGWTDLRVKARCV